jgi:ABC-2 type transport system ATP-binding protein
MSEDVVIRVKGVSKNFALPHDRPNSIKGLFTGATKGHKKREPIETQHALDDISFEIKKGEFFGIVGRNGSGKSTMLKILAGIYQPTHGSVQVTGRLVPFIELGVGFNGELTGRENVYLNGAMLGFSRKEIDVMYHDIVEFAELERFMDKKLKNYSSGMQVRLAFSMATRAEADVLLVDEVLAVGDADFQRKCFEYFRQLKKNKKTVVFVSHDMGAVRQYCDRAVLIEKSHLVLSDTADKVATQYTRMFSDESHLEIDSKNNRRWGNKKVAFSRIIKAPTKLNDKKAEIIVQVEVTAKQAIDNIVIGFSIKNATGNGVLGTNTRVEKIETGSWAAEESRMISWSFQNIFSDGNYSIDLALVEEDGSTVCDWWEGAAEFLSFEETPTGYLTRPKIMIELEKSKHVS